MGGAQIGPVLHSDSLAEPGLNQNWSRVGLGWSALAHGAPSLRAEACLVFGTGFPPSGSPITGWPLPSERMSPQGPAPSRCSTNICQRMGTAIARPKYLTVSSVKEMDGLTMRVMDSPKRCEERAITPLGDPRMWMLILVAFSCLEERVVMLTGLLQTHQTVRSDRQGQSARRAAPSPPAHRRCATSADGMGKRFSSKWFAFGPVGGLMVTRVTTIPGPLTAPRPPLPAVGRGAMEAREVVLDLFLDQLLRRAVSVGCVCGCGEGKVSAEITTQPGLPSPPVPTLPPPALWRPAPWLSRHWI